MKKIITTLTLFIALMLPLAHASFEDDADCSAIPSLGFLPNLFKNDCKLIKGQETNYCNCLKNSNNILLNAASLSHANELKKYQDDLKKSYNNKLMKVLFQINTGVHLQEQTFGIKKTGGETDCNASKFAKEFTNSICKTFNNDGKSCKDEVIPNGSEYAGKAEDYNLSNCRMANTCKEVYKNIDDAWILKKIEIEQGTVNNPSNPVAQTGIVGLALKGTKAVLAGTQAVNISGKSFCNITNGCSGQGVSTAQQVKESGADDPSPAPPASSAQLNCSLSDNQINQIKDMVDFFDNYSGIVDPQVVSNLKAIDRKKYNCEHQKLFFDAQEEYKFKISFASGGMSIAKKIDLRVTQEIETALRNQNKRGEEILKEGFRRSQSDNACVSYDKYKVLASAPGSNLISDWAKMTGAEIAESLDPKVLSSSSNPSALQFIRNNPLLAKMVISKSTRTQLSNNLKLFANKNQGQSKPSQLQGFIEFMKKDASKIDTGFIDYYQCDLLARNAAAVYSSNLILPNEHLENSAFSMKSNFYACAMQDQQNKNNFKPANFDEIVESNALLDILGSPSESSVNDPEKDVGYKSYLQNNCKGYSEFRKDFIDNYCNKFFRGKKCAEKFSNLNRSRIKRLNKKYYSELNPEMGQLVSIVSNSTNHVDFDDLADSSADASQNDQLYQVYEEKIKPQTFSSIFDFTNAQSDKISKNFDDLAQMQADYDKRAASSSTGRGTSLSDLSNNDTNSKSGKSIEGDSITNIRKTINSPENSPNLGQVVPNYLSNTQSQNAAPVMESRNISSLKQANDLVDKVTGKEGANLKPENKEEVVKNVQKYIDGTKDNSSEMAKLQDKILDLEDQISEDRKNKTNGRSTASLGAGDASQVTPSSKNQMNQNYSGAIPFAPGFSPAVAAGGKIQRAQAASAASYQKALNDKYTQSEKDSTPYNRTSDQFVLNKEPYVGASGEELLVGLEMSPSTKEFSKIVDSEANLLKYLNENLIKIPGSKIISIKCGPQCDDKANDLLLHVERDQFNKIVIRSVASSTPVVRVHKLDVLNKEFKGIK